VLQFEFNFSLFWSPVVTADMISYNLRNKNVRAIKWVLISVFIICIGDSLV
jgi:hypothetical protein